MVKGVSVVIVTLNGKGRLLTTLENLAKQKRIDFDWEVLVIDNNSDDGTAEFVKDFWNEEINRPCPLRVYQEKRAGTLFARNAGFEIAKYRYVLFCDDDNSLCNNYVKTAYEYIQKNSQIAAVGGVGIPKFEAGIIVPKWVYPFLRFLGCGAQGDTTGDTTYKKGCLYTAGAIIDRIWINKLYKEGYEPKLKGRDSKSLIAGEDTELTYGLKAIGGQLHFCEEMEFLHYIPEKRLTLDYFKRLYAAMGYSDFVLEYYYKRKRSLIISWVIVGLSVIKHFVMVKYLGRSLDKIQLLLHLHKQIGKWQAHNKIFRDVLRATL